MQFFGYGLGYIAADPPETQGELLERLHAWGFRTNPHWRACESIEEVVAFCEEWREKRHTLDYDMDGVVVVPRLEAAEVSQLSAERIAKEQKSRERLRNTELGVNMYGLKAKLLELGVRYVEDEKELNNG